MRRLLSLVLTLTLWPAIASALTVQDVLALSKAGVAESVLLAMIERDNSIFPLDADQVIAFTREGVSEKVVVAMLKSGRQGPPPAPSDRADRAESAPGPLLVMVGHGPERPNTYHDIDALGNYIYPVTDSFVFAPPVVPFPYGPFVAAPSSSAVPPCRPPHSASGVRGARSGPAAESARCRAR